jgi:hypothetical protein
VSHSQTGGYPKRVAARLQAHRNILSGFASSFSLQGSSEGTFLFCINPHGTPIGRDERNWMPSVHNHEAFTL